MRNKAIILIGILIVLLLMTYSLRSQILKISHPRWIRSLVELVMPPKDLYSLLLKEEMDISKRGVVKRFSFTNRYAGRYNVGLMLGNYSDEVFYASLDKRYRLKLELEFAFYHNGKLITSLITSTNYDTIISSNGKGISLLYYECPQELPIDKIIECEVTVKEPDTELAGKYGPSRLFISRLSDL